MSTPTTPDVDRTPTQPRRPSAGPLSPSPLRPTSPTFSNASGSTLSAALHSGLPRRSQTPATPSTAIPVTAPSPDYAERRRSSKARDLLRRHYGMTVGPPTPSGKPSDPMDIGTCYPCHTGFELEWSSAQIHHHLMQRLTMISSSRLRRSLFFSNKRTSSSHVR